MNQIKTGCKEKSSPILSIDNNTSMENEKLDQIFIGSQKETYICLRLFKYVDFYVELKESGKIISGINYPNLINSQGDVPEDPPEKFQTDGDVLFDHSQDNEEDMNLDYDEDPFIKKNLACLLSHNLILQNSMLRS